jgi:hypothetical protein
MEFLSLVQAETLLKQTALIPVDLRKVYAGTFMQHGSFRVFRGGHDVT